VLVYLTVPVDQTTRERKQIKPRNIAPLREVVANDAVKAMLAYFVTRGFWRQSFNAFYPLYAVAAFSSGEANVGMVLSTYMFAEGLLQIPFGFLADRYPRIRQIVVGSVFAPLILLAVPFVSAPWAVALLTFGMGAFSALGRASLVAIRTELGRTHGMATLAGIQGSAFAVGQALGPLLTGMMVDAVGLLAVFPFGSAIGCVGTVMVLAWLTRWKRTDPGAPAMAKTRVAH
jgi:MFS family permease